MRIIQIVVAISECNPAAIAGNASITIVLSKAPIRVPNTKTNSTMVCLEFTKRIICPEGIKLIV